MLWHRVSENKKAGKSARSILLHPVQRCYKFPIPLHPSSSNLIPFISQTPYIYLTGFQHFRVYEFCKNLEQTAYYTQMNYIDPFYFHGTSPALYSTDEIKNRAETCAEGLVTLLRRLER